jgi:D-lactate dehydrogenase
MKIAVFSTRAYDRQSMAEIAAKSRAFSASHQLEFFDVHLRPDTVRIAEGYDAVCVFVNDVIDREVLERLYLGGVRLVALRCAGYNNVDLKAAQQIGVTVVRVPAYSPEAVAEHAVALILALNRKICRAYHRVREGNFSLEGLVGFNLHGKTVGLIGTGRIGAVVARILGPGFGCNLLGFDPEPNQRCVELGLKYVSLPELVANSDIISLHAPLAPSTSHLINDSTIAMMKRDVMLINTSRGGLIDTKAVIKAIKTGKIGSLGLDVYEEEAGLFFYDRSLQAISDDVFARLLTFPNVLITGHQGFLTQEALEHIAQTTINNILEYALTGICCNEVVAEDLICSSGPKSKTSLAQPAGA